MTWKCADCNAVETERGESSIKVVCHHCGKPLCREDQTLIVDDAFYAESRVDLPVAVHCKGCRQTHHPKAAVIEGSRQ